MAMNGASEIHSLDVSPLNVESTKRNVQLFGYENIIKVKLSSLEKIPFQDQEFDFVWCNGVLMHTHNPDQCLMDDWKAPYLRAYTNYDFSKRLVALGFKNADPLSMGTADHYTLGYTGKIDDKFSQIETLTQDSLLLRIIAFSYIQRNLRDNIFANHENFSLDRSLQYFDDMISYLNKFSSRRGN